MKPPETVKRLIKETSFNASEEMDQTLRAGIAQACSDSQATLTPERRQTRRFIYEDFYHTRSPGRHGLRRRCSRGRRGSEVVSVPLRGPERRRIARIFLTEPEVIRREGTAEDPNGNVLQTITMRGVKVGIQSQVAAGTLAGDGEEVDAEQAQADLEEINQLRQQGARRLVRTIEKETENGPIRVNIYEYTLSDGRTITMGENDPGQARPGGTEEPSVEPMQADLEEIDQLRQKGDRRLVRTIDTGPIRVNIYEYTLSDGRTITMGEDEPSQK